MSTRCVYDAERVSSRLQTVAAREALIDYLTPVPFQLIMTLRPVGHRGMETCQQIERDIINLIEIHHKAPTSTVSSYEQVPYPNSHILLASSVPLDVRWIAAGFRDGFASTIQNPDTGEIRPFLRHFDFEVDAKVEVIESKERALHYIFKQATFAEESDLKLRNLDFYLNQSHTGRRMRRFQERQHNATSLQ
jgi:hypothetical protein